MRPTPLRTIRQRLRRACTVPNVVSTFAVFASMGGSAYAVTMYTGSNVGDSTLTGADFRNLSIEKLDFSLAAITAIKIKGATGPQGFTGPTGDKGLLGSKGATGDNGNAAPNAYTFQTSPQDTRVNKVGEPNPSTIPSVNECLNAGDDPLGCTGFRTGTPYMYPRWDFRCIYYAGTSEHCETTNTSDPRLTRSNQPLIVTSQNTSGGLLSMPYSGTIVLNASATFYTQFSSLNQRVECQLQLQRMENGAAVETINVGAPAVVSRYIDPAGNPNQRQRLNTVSVTGAAAQAAGTFDSQLACRAPDENGQPNDRLEFIEGNMSVLTTRTNGGA